MRLTLKATLCVVVFFVATGTCLALTSSPAAACTTKTSLVNITQTCFSNGSSSEEKTTTTDDVVTYSPVCAEMLENTCATPANCGGSGGSTRYWINVIVNGAIDHVTCLGQSDEEAAGPNGADVLTAFRRLKWPASKLTIQPPDGQTLVNFDTNFYTADDEPITRRVTLLGQRITIEATPIEYTWHFGDGSTLTTTKPGHAYPRLSITNNYLETGTYRPSLDTTYGGRYRVGNNSWHDIPGTVTVTGTPQNLEAIEARPILMRP